MRVLLVDDHLLLCNGVKQFLAHRPGIEIVGQANTGREALQYVERLAPELIIMDVHLPDISGIEVMKKILTRFPAMKILIFTGDSNRSVLDNALRAGVRAFVLKTSPVEELLHAIEASSSERLYVCSELNTELLEEYRSGLNQRPQNAHPELNEREIALLRLVAAGNRTKEIAAELGVTAKSVETHRSRLMKKLGCGSTAELVRYAVRQGIVQA